jgi:cyclopropane fatty-acyl-phospholipid synthase-like methyltransferase
MTRTAFTADDFNKFYPKPDPWSIGHAFYRDKTLCRCIARFTDGKSVLELGCGEGHLTGTVFAGAKRVHGIDISEVAIARHVKRFTRAVIAQNGSDRSVA